LDLKKKFFKKGEGLKKTRSPNPPPPPRPFKIAPIHIVYNFYFFFILHYIIVT